MSGQPILSKRALNRALLARQKLLQRADMPAIELIEHLVGVQAQIPNGPYTSLWTRLTDFEPAELSELLENRKVVRATLMRATIHLVSSDDLLAIRPLMQPVIERAFYGQAFGKAVAGMNVEDVLSAGRALLDERPRTTAELRTLLLERWPDGDADAVAFAVKYILPLVQVPPRGIWGKTALPTWTTIDAWLGQPLVADPDPERLVARYLAAFGPATIADFRNWSRLSGHKDVFEGLRSQLVTFRDEKNRELFDVPGAPRPDPDIAAPPRFFHDYDNVFLGHADRSRIIDVGVGKESPIGTSSFTVDGFLAGTWKIERKKGAATLLMEPFGKTSKRDRSALAEEGATLLKFLAEDLDHDIRFVPA